MYSAICSRAAVAQQPPARNRNANVPSTELKRQGTQHSFSLHAPPNHRVLTHSTQSPFSKFQSRTLMGTSAIEHSPVGPASCLHTQPHPCYASASAACQQSSHHTSPTYYLTVTRHHYALSADVGHTKNLRVRASALPPLTPAALPAMPARARATATHG